MEKNKRTFGEPTRPIPFRLGEYEKQVLEEIARREERTMADALRRILRQQGKQLGIEPAK